MDLKELKVGDICNAKYLAGGGEYNFVMEIIEISHGCYEYPIIALVPTHGLALRVSVQKLNKCKKLQHNIWPLRPNEILSKIEGMQW